MSDTKTNNEICPVCKAAAKLMCTGCNTVYYCSREHQKSDWKFHSKNCGLVKLVHDPKMGRRYVATRGIKVDEIFLREKKPLLVYPWFEPAHPTPTCLNCYVPLMTVDETKQCNNCGWYMCLSCTKHGPECELTLKYRKSKITREEFMLLWPPSDNTTKTLHLYTMSIIAIRALALRENDPKAYKKLLRLEDHFGNWVKYKPTPPFMRPSDGAKFVKKLMNTEDLDEAEILKILGIMAINAFACGPNHHGVLFDKCSYMEHSCQSNSSTVIRDHTINATAVVPIAKGAPITISYGKSCSGTAKRRQELATTKFFDCHCERCKDPTEFGTMFSAVKCITVECTGYMLPPTFLVRYGEEIPNYVCDKCKMTIPSIIINQMMKHLSERYSEVIGESVIELKKSSDKLATVLHENHFMIYPVELALTETITNQSAIFSAEVLRENVKRCKKLAYLLETLMPEQYPTRGANLFRMHLCNFALLLKEHPSEIEFIRQIKEYKEVLIEAKRLLCEEPAMTKQVEEELTALRRSEIDMELMISMKLL